MNGARRRRRPLIGITTSELRRAESSNPLAEGDPARLELALGTQYTDSVVAAGGAPVVLPPMDARCADEIVDSLDGIVLAGGPDIDPSTYGAEPHPELGPTEPEIDQLEITVLRAADRFGLPVLAICRGMQALNVRRGGTLHQHLPDVVGEEVPHRQTVTGTKPTHDVRIEPGSLLGRLIGDETLSVNSFHHQAIDRLGDGLRPVAWAPDGVIEAVEATDRSFVLGVQWHSEALSSRPADGALFEALVAEAGSHHTPGVRAA